MERKLYDLTSPQKNIWNTEEFFKGTSISNICGVMTIEKNVNLKNLEKSLNFYVQKNDSARLQFCIENNIPKQYIKEYIPFNIDVVNLHSKDELIKLQNDLNNIPFKTIDCPMFKFTLFRFDDNSGGVIAIFHHLISDAWTMKLLIDQTADVYNKLEKSEEIDTSIQSSYLDFINSEKLYIDSDKFNSDKLYWQSVFNTEPENSNIKEAKSNVSLANAKRISFSLNKTLSTNIVEFCKNNNISIFTFMMSIFSIYLSNILNLNDVIIGTPVLNRLNFKQKQTSGMFISTVPCKLTVNENLNFLDFASNVAQSQLSIFRHQKYPFENLLEDIRNLYSTVNNLFDVNLSYQNARDNNKNIDLKYHTDWIFNGYISDSLDIHIYDMDNNDILNIFYDYQISKFSKEDISNIHNRILYIIDQILNNPNILIKDIEIITKEEKDVLENTFNNSSIFYPHGQCIHNIIDFVAQKFPNNIAISFNNEFLTYKELNAKSNMIAKNLIIKGILPGDCVSILLKEKNLDLIASMLGILKAGASFLAIYPDYPEDRIKYILENSKSKLLITEPSLNNFSDLIPYVYMSDFQNITTQIYFPEIDENSNCYIIYTSGSTGNPKGVALSHKNLVNFVFSFKKILHDDITTLDRFLSVTNICFDVSICEIFTPLSFGASLFLYKDLNYSTPGELAQFVANNNITFAYFPPSLLEDVCNNLIKFDNVVLNKLLVGVEPIKAFILNNFLKINKNMIIINGYGPTETTICCTMYDFNNDIPKDAIVPIGKPFGNTKIYLYNKFMQLVPINCVGEIYVSGDGVGNSYLFNSDLTNKSFINFNNMRLYKTGDLAKWSKDGVLHFIGRNDNQIKYRGYRIDLSEIEYTIKNHPYVKNTLVILDKTTYSSEKLIAFVAYNNSAITINSLREFLSGKLPHYMIPNKFVFLENFQLTPNGKISKKHLISILENETEKKEYIAPNTNFEKTLVSLWEKALNKSPIGVTDDFFELGGDSLLAMKISAIAAEKSIQLSAQDFYNFPTIALLSKNINVENYINYSENYIKSIDLYKKSILKIDGDILLTGATGFLGSHILRDLIVATDFKIYCIIRAHNKEEATDRLKERLHFYFGNVMDELFGERIIILNGDFSLNHLNLDDITYNNLLNSVKTVINSAALVKHIGDYTYFNNMNIKSVQILIDFCKESMNHAHLIHISTMSVSGYSKDKLLEFSEKDLYVGQNVDENIYIKTKFNAEQLIAKNMKNGLNATIFRLGNITWRDIDGQFQFNYTENLFFNILQTIINTKIVSNSMKNYIFNISPVDLCSKIIVNILLNNNKLNIYHIFNYNTLSLSEIIALLNILGLDIHFIDDATYQKEMSNLAKINTYNDFSISNTANTSTLGIDNNISIKSKDTIEIMKDLNFAWPLIDDNYFKKFLGGKSL